MQSCPKPGNELYTQEPEYADYMCIEDLELSLLVLVKIPTGLLSTAVLIALLLPHAGVLHHCKLALTGLREGRSASRKVVAATESW
eukprot:22681-Rhodomonas_salina.1